MAQLSIPTTGKPVALRAYRVPLLKRTIIDDHIDHMLADDVIEPSSSPYSSPVTLQRKKDLSWRFCVDFRVLNSQTTKDSYPLPLIDDIFDLTAGKSIYSTLDFKAGYHQLAVASKDRFKTAFRCHRGLYQFKKVPFGLTSAPAFFQRTLDKILTGYIGKFCFIYIDDLVVFSDNVTQHAHHLTLIFDRIRDANLRLKPTKCSFGLPEVKLLGYIIGANGKRTDPEKTAAITDMPPPKTVRGVRSFLGLANYYATSLYNYAEIAEPLLDLTRKNRRFHWTDTHQTAFNTLKAMLTSTHVMAPPDSTKPYKLFTDASDHSIGSILVQDDAITGRERVIQYLSHSLSKSERRWATLEKEGWALIYSLKKLHCYLHGAKVTAYTDHKPLKCLFTKQLNNTKLQRWAILLSEYAVDIQYRQGSKNIKADMLSRIERDDTPLINIIDTSQNLPEPAIPPPGHH